MINEFSMLAAAAPNATALVEGVSGKIVTRRQLFDRAEAWVRTLVAAGLKARDLIAIQLPNSEDFIAAILAAARCDLVAVPIDRDAPEGEVGAILGHFGIRGLLYRTDSSTTTLSTRVVNGPIGLPADARLLKLTSGSTGKPKGIVTSERNLIADCTNIVSTMEIRADDVNFGAIPFSHSYGFSNLVTPLLLQGTSIVITNDYIPQAIIELCNRHRCTILPGIPMIFEHLHALPRGDGEFESVRSFISAGAPLQPTTSRHFRARFGTPIHSFYGCSECGGITYDRAGGAAENGNVGASMRGVTLSTDRGRLAVESDAVALGYLVDAATFTSFDARRFVTDDLVSGIGEEAITLTGRSSEQINIAGKKVNPREVENVLLQIEGVREAKVYGEPAGARGEVVAAAIVASPDVTREQIRAFCSERLSSHKVPRIVKLIESIPLDERGKVKRAALAQL